jgi:hypothetical protein
MPVVLMSVVFASPASLRRHPHTCISNRYGSRQSYRRAAAPHGLSARDGQFLCRDRRGLYGFHFTGVTASGVPVAELTQPSVVRRHG